MGISLICHRPEAALMAQAVEDPEVITDPDDSPEESVGREGTRLNLAVSAALWVTIAATFAATIWYASAPMVRTLGGQRRSGDDSFAETAYPWITDAGTPLALFQLADSSYTEAADATHMTEIGHGGVEFGSAQSWHAHLPADLVKLDGPAERAAGDDATLNADEMMSQAELGEDGAHSTFMVCNQHHDVSHLSAMQLVGIEPIVTRIPGIDKDNSVVHHMNLYLCTSEEAVHSKIGRCVDGAKVMPSDMERPCYRMVYAYDRDSRPFYFPKDVGVRLGKGSPYTRLVQEWHYLLPTKGVHTKFTDFTRFKLLLTARPRKHNAAIIGMMNVSMVLPPGKTAYHHSFTCPPHKVQAMLARDLAKFGSVQPFAVHLHSHENGKKLWWDHLRNGKKIGEFGRIDKYRGYGRHESFLHLNNKLNSPDLQREFNPGTTGAKSAKILPGDSLRINCVFDTTKAKRPIVYGTNHGEEMCGNLMMYYPHDWQELKHKESACISADDDPSPADRAAALAATPPAASGASDVLAADRAALAAVRKPSNP